MGWRGEGVRFARLGVLAASAFALAHCAAADKYAKNSKYSPKVVADGEPVPKGGGAYRVGNPYSINGRTYYPAENTSYRAEGTASWYGPDFHGRLTANGEVYDMHSISAAHTTMPMPSYARVTNLDNGNSIIVRVNDRGPYARNRIIDLSIGTAKALDFYSKGVARVRVEYVGRAPVDGSDDRMLLATLRQGSPAPAPSRVMLAAAKPFLPVVEESRPTASPPIPGERPFSLGAQKSSASASTEPVGVNRAATRSAVRLPAGVTSGPLPGLGQAPAASFVPERGEGSLGLMSGRGLY